MIIKLSQFAGFCDGVARAYDMVAGLNMEAVKKPVFILGSLVHNDDVNRKITEKGIIKINLEELKNSKTGNIGTLIITAHGDGPEIYQIAKEKNIDIIDTTCPKVIKVQRLAEVYKKRGYEIVIIGDAGHKEVVGIDQWGGGESLIIPKTEDVEKIKFKKDSKIVVLSQTTQDEKLCEKIGSAIQKRYSNAEILSTICHATRNRQEEIRKLAGENDAVVVIGSPDSANSTRLFEIAKSINPSSYFIERAGDLKKEWFINIKKLAVTAGASTPSWIIDEAMKRLREGGIARSQ